MNAVLVSSLIAAGAGLLASPASAGLSGTSMTLRYDYSSWTPTVDSLIVGPGVEITCTGGGNGNANVCQLLNAGVHTVDIGDDGIAYALTSGTAAFTAVSPNGFNFLNLAIPIAGITFTHSIAGMDSSRVSFTSSSISVDMSGLVVEAGQGFALGVVAVPEPASAWLMLAGAAALGAWVLRRR
ncbi:MAG: PEP-CTERM sorting domain-containing protein [Burkholderiaceae bacterium]|nr:PEP-CTERM sorting domain-containing protein [Burkholderiaceae bacterium]